MISWSILTCLSVGRFQAFHWSWGCAYDAHGLPLLHAGRGAPLIRCATTWKFTVSSHPDFLYFILCLFGLCSYQIWVAFSPCSSAALWCHITLGIMWQRAQELQQSKYSVFFPLVFSNVHTLFLQNLLTKFLLCFSWFFHSGMLLQLYPSSLRLFSSSMLVWMHSILKSGSLPVTGQLNVVFHLKKIMSCQKLCLRRLSIVVSHLQPWKIHWNKLNFARIGSGGTSCFCFPSVAPV